MTRFANCLFLLLFVLAGAFLGYMVGMQTPDLIHKGAFVTWRAFHLPEGHTAARFMEKSSDSVWVETDAGRWFSSPLSLDDTPAWEQRNLAVDDMGAQAAAAGECRRGAAYNPQLVVMPSLRTVVDRIHCWYSPHAEYYSDMILIIDRKGDIYRWLNKDPGIGIFFWLTVCSVAGVVVGALMGFLIHRRFVHRRQNLMML